MKVLFAALTLAHFRNFESAIREMAARGHHVHLTSDEPEGLGGEALARRLVEECGGRVSWDRLPQLDDEPWYDAARRFRVALDYVRALDPQYPSKLRVRAEERTARVVRWMARLPGGAGTARRGLTRLERLMPTSAALLEYLRRIDPDVVVLGSLTQSRSQQMDLLKAARASGKPVAAAIMGWDHLSSKALLHLQPDQVIVWNPIQKREAIEMHGIPAERIVVTGAQCYDQWFTRTPERSREEFCGAMGLRADRPFVLWVHSALTPAPSPPEPMLVQRWIEALRRSTDSRLRELGVLVRPHPERLKEWAGVTLHADNVAFHGRNPIDRDAKNDYFESLYYSSAVVGLVTTAFVEAAVVGRTVLTMTLPEYRMHQEEMIHFQYLTTVGGGLLHSAPDLDTHLRQLSDAVAHAVSSDGARDDRNRRFVQEFVRPAGLDVPATPAFVDAIEALRRDGSRDDASLTRGAWLRPAVAAASSWSRTGVGRWLMNDLRTDARDDHEEYTGQVLQARRAAKAARVEAKARRKAWRQRRDAVMLKAKEVRSALRLLRYRAAMFAHRMLGKGTQP
jgi:glycosyltransferase involved in cell wall biosynthesis/GNAT superfamily N-acetyltransferase